ncbi:hypothetical protein [Nonomuraea sp. LPB2021202275-12-8]|uniref:hypothetical protein n=1 Tax=Nonomuraea sp. LPB2021202275-12-8 TaxID=3120159 RepID=UPI00300D1A9B
MARDENDRPYEDGQGRSSNPDLTGDVLSPRWSTDDTDEQPAIQVSGNETYILPPDKGVPVDGGETAYPDGQTGYAEAEAGSHLTEAQPDGRYAGDAPSGPQYTDGDAGEAPYLPLDKSYEGAYDEEPEEPRRGFLGSGWTEHSGDEPGRGDREVRRRTRLLLVAAVAVVLIGGGAGWMLTGTSSDDPCAGGHCASVGDLNHSSSAPAEEESDVPIDEATDTATPDPTVSEAVTPTSAPTRVRVRSTPTPTRERKPTRTAEPTAKPTIRATEAPVNEIDDADTRSQPKDQETAADSPAGSFETEQAQTPTQAPMPTPTERKGLLDILFPWA